jgi:hypothetical protein
MTGMCNHVLLQKLYSFAKYLKREKKKKKKLKKIDSS